ncbi:hypothetical protein GCM10027570_04340 [Streptomonospora sediminis]
MRTWRRAPLSAAAAAGAALLVAGTACTAGGEPDRPQDSPRPLPTSFTGEVPPGVGREPLRHLHGPGGAGPAILGDDMGVRISSVGDAFLISSNSKERHVLVGAEDGETLWHGRRQIQRFGTGADGSQVLLVDGRGGGTEVIGADGDTVWRGTGRRESFVGGAVVRRPAGWSADDPYGDYTVLDPGGEELWDYTFAAPAPGGGASDGANGEDEDEDANTAESPTEPDPDRNGVPVAARDGVLLLDDGAGLLQARGIGAENAGELLWSIAGDDPDLAGGTDVQRPRAQVVGTYDIPGDHETGGTGEDTSETADATPGAGGSASPPPEQGEGAGAGSTGSSEDAAETDGAGGAEDPPTGPAVLVRWSAPEQRSVLSLLDLHTGDLLWSFAEPGANPGGGEFAPPPLQGALYEPRTGTLLLPQATGATPLIAVDLVAGEVRWRFEDESEQAITPALAMGGYIYGDTAGTDGSASDQVVLNAADKDVAAEGLNAYVEAATTDGYSIIVRNRQRFVFPPAEAPPADEPTGPTATPTPSS